MCVVQDHLRLTCPFILPNTRLVLCRLRTAATAHNYRRVHLSQDYDTFAELDRSLLHLDTVFGVWEVLERREFPSPSVVMLALVGSLALNTPS